MAISSELYPLPSCCVGLVLNELGNEGSSLTPLDNKICEVVMAAAGENAGSACVSSLSGIAAGAADRLVKVGSLVVEAPSVW